MKIDFDNIINETLKRFPEYVHTSHYEHSDHELAYSFFFGFSEYIIELAKKEGDPMKSASVLSAFDLFNEMIESSDKDLSDLGVVEVIETLVQERVGKELCQTLLRAKGQYYLIEVLKFTGVRD